MTPRERIVASARRWIGTPFQHQGRAFAVGVDCGGLIINVGIDEGYFPAGFDVPAYSREPRNGMLESLLDTHLEPVEEPEVGDVLLMTFGGPPQHCGFLTESGTIIHAYSVVKRVVEHGLDHKWRRRIVAAYKFKGLA